MTHSSGHDQHSGDGRARASRTERSPQPSGETSRDGSSKRTSDSSGSSQLGASTDALPETFGRYRILRKLGTGAMGMVYLAHDTQLDRRVAIKTPIFGRENPKLVERFYREARAAAKLHHPNICPIYDVGEIEGRLFISMAYIEGRPLSDFVRGDRLPSPRNAALLIHRLAKALAEAHRHKIVHRDLKPANIMITREKEPMVMDFGLARQTDIDSQVTQSGALLGTPAYMAPEQIRETGLEAGPAIDIYALGVIFYELLTGRLPFSGSVAQVLYKIVHEPPVPPSEIRRGIDSNLEAICLRMMTKDPVQRFASMDEVTTVLRDYLLGKNTASAKTSPSPDSTDTADRAKDSGALAGELNTFLQSQASSEVVAQEPSQSPKDAGREAGFRLSHLRLSALVWVSVPLVAVFAIVWGLKVFRTKDGSSHGQSTARSVEEASTPTNRASQNKPRGRSRPAASRPSGRRVGSPYGPPPWWPPPAMRQPPPPVATRHPGQTPPSARFGAPSRTGTEQPRRAGDPAGARAAPDGTPGTPEEKPAPVAPVEIPTPIAYFPFDGTLAEVATLRDVTAPLGPVEFVPDRHARPSAALKLASTAQLEITDDEGLYPVAGGNPVAISCWVRSSSTYTLVSKFFHLDPTHSHFCVAMDSPGQLAVMGNGTDRLDHRASRTYIRPNEWHFLVVQLIPSRGAAEIWLDSRRIAQGKMTFNASPQSDQPLRIGFLPREKPSGRSAPFELDDLAFFDTVLTRSQIEALFRRSVKPSSEPLFAEADHPLRKAAPPKEEPPRAIVPFEAHEAKRLQQRWADYLKIPVRYTTPHGIEFVLIPPGEFVMGSDRARHTRPRHPVRLTWPYYLSTTEVTQHQYMTVMGRNPSLHRHSMSDQLPVESVVYEEALEFCIRLGDLDGRVYRLPTEAEWEFAARAGVERGWWFGKDKLDDHVWYADNSGDTIKRWEKYFRANRIRLPVRQREQLKKAGCRPRPVGTKPANPFGLFDMEGNVAEWCCDFYAHGYPSRGAAENPTGPLIGTTRVARGGSFLSVASTVQPWQRSNVLPLSGRIARYDSLGVRVLREIGRVQRAAPEVVKARRKVGGIREKTLVVWAQVADLKQQEGGVLAICTKRGVPQKHFDAIVFGTTGGKWRFGSDTHYRERRGELAEREEKMANRRFVQIAISDQNNVVTIYRDGVPYAQYQANYRHPFESDHRIIMGLQVRLATSRFAGVIEEARIYDRALDAETIAILKPNTVSDPPPLGMWTFEDGSALDIMGAYKRSVLYGAARIEKGRLYLDGKTAFVECFVE